MLERAKDLQNEHIGHTVAAYALPLRELFVQQVLRSDLAGSLPIASMGAITGIPIRFQPALHALPVRDAASLPAARA